MNSFLNAELDIVLAALPLLLAYLVKVGFQLEQKYITDPRLRGYIKDMVVAAAQCVPAAANGSVDHRKGWVYAQVMHLFPKTDPDYVNNLIETIYRDAKDALSAGAKAA